MDSQAPNQFEPNEGKIYTKFMKDIAWGLSSNDVMMLRFNKPAAQLDYFFDPEASDTENDLNIYEFNLEYSTIQNDFLVRLCRLRYGVESDLKRGLLDTSRVSWRTLFRRSIRSLSMLAERANWLGVSS